MDKGDGYQRVRMAFGMLLGQYGNAAYLASNYVGGEAMHRDHAGDPNGRDPFVPVKAAKQREALKLLQDRILTDKPFQFSPQLLRRLAADRWSHWGNEGAVYARRRLSHPPAHPADSAAGARTTCSTRPPWPASRTTP